MIPFWLEFYQLAISSDVELLERCSRVLSSCDTPEQFRAAARYAELVQRQCILGESKAEAVRQKQHCLRNSIRLIGGGYG